MAEPFDPAKLKALHEALEPFDHYRLEALADYMLAHRAAICALASRAAELEGKLDRAYAFVVLGWTIEDALKEHPDNEIGQTARVIQEWYAARQKKGPTP